MQFTPYLSFNGDCGPAFKFYEQVLNGKITFIMTWGESPVSSDVPVESHHLIMHATLTVGDVTLMGADAMPDDYQQPQGINVSLQVRDVAEAKRIFNTLAKSGTIKLPFQPTFWSPGFGMCVDQFGIPWMISCEQDHP